MKSTSKNIALELKNLGFYFMERWHNTAHLIFLLLYLLNKNSDLCFYQDCRENKIYSWMWLSFKFVTY